MPPESKVMPLPTRPSTGPSVTPFRLIAHDDQGGRLLGALGDAPEGAHLQLGELFGGVDLALEADFRCHGGGALAQNGGR